MSPLIDMVSVTTRNRPAEISRLSCKIRALGPAWTRAILFTDDSSNNCNFELNHASVIGLPFEYIYYVSTENWEDVCRLMDLISPVAGALSRSFSLGASTWNTPSARNIGQIISSLLSESGWRLQLDDDAIPNKDITLSSRKQQLALFSLDGFADYSRITWLLWYFALHSISFMRACTLNSILPNSDTAYRRESHLHMLYKYTDLGQSLDLKSNISQDMSTIIHPLCGNVGHGVAFASNIPATKTPLFIPFVQEDQHWTGTLVRAGIEYSTAGHIHHDPLGRKTILCANDILREEVGFAVDHALQLGNCYPVHQTLPSLLRYRKRKIQVIQSLLSKHTHSFEKSDMFRFAIEILDEAQSKIISKEMVLSALSSISEYQKTSILWQSFCRLSSKIKQQLRQAIVECISIKP